MELRPIKSGILKIYEGVTAGFFMPRYVKFIMICVLCIAIVTGVVFMIKRLFLAGGE